LRHDADDRVRRAISIRHDLSTKYLRIAVEPVLPGSVAQDRDRLRAAQVICW
jgi:hypothetical protein